MATDPRHIAAPMVGVAQLFAGDVQGLPCAAGADVCQVLWCPSWHEPDFGPRVRVRWRDSHDPGLDGVLAVAPPIDPDTAKENYIPKPCSLSPEQTIDYPGWRDLPEESRPRIEAWEQDSDWIYASHVSAASGSKVGGRPVWTQEPEWRRVPGATPWTTCSRSPVGNTTASHGGPGGPGPPLQARRYGPHARRRRGCVHLHLSDLRRLSHRQRPAELAGSHRVRARAARSRQRCVMPPCGEHDQGE